MKTRYLKRLFIRYLLFAIFFVASLKLFLSQESRIIGIVFFVVSAFITYVFYRIHRIYDKGFYYSYFLENMKLGALSAFLFLIFTLLVSFSSLLLLNMFILTAAISFLCFSVVRVILLRKV